MPPLSSYRSVLSIKVPATTPWDTRSALQMATGLYATSRPFNLVIRATPTGIKWQIEIGQDQTVTVKNLIKSTFSRAEVDETPKAGIDKGFYLFQIEGALPYILNLKPVSIFQQDPLAILIGNMQGFEYNQEAVYELVFGLPTQNYLTLGEKMLSAQANRWQDYMTEAGRNDAINRQMTGTERIQKYNDAIDKPAREKLLMSLREVRFLLKIKARNKDQAKEIGNRLITGLAPFDNIANALIVGDSESFPLVLSPLETAALWHLPTEDIKTEGVEWSTGLYAPMPMALVHAHERPSIVLGTSKSQDKEYPVKLAYADRVTHVNIVGMTRVGKSTFIHNMVHQDIYNGRGVAVLDPHGDLIKAILSCSIPESRIADVVLLNVSDTEYPVGLNFLAPQTGISTEDAAGHVLAVIRKMFAEQWSATRMEDVLYASIVSLMRYPNATLPDIPKLLTNSAFRHQVTRNLTDVVAKAYWRDEFETLSESAQREIARPINSRLRRFYRNQTLLRLMGQPASLDFRALMDSRKILLMNLHGVPEVEQETLGAMLISRIQMAAMSRGNTSALVRVPFYFYIDEVQNFIATSLSQLFSEAGKYQISLTVGNQFLKQLEGDTLDAVLGNVGTNIIFRVGHPDARALAGTVRPQVTPDELQNLDRFQTVVKVQLAGQTLPAFSMLTAKAPPENDKADEIIARIRDQSRRKYAKTKEQVDKELNALYGTSIVSDASDGDGPDEPRPVSFLG